MNKLFLLAFAAALLPMAAQAQDAILPTGVVAPAAPPTAAPAPAAATSATPLIARAPETPAASPNAIKVKAEANPATGRLTVKTDNPGPTRVELTDVGGRPVLTHAMMNGQTPVVLNVSRLPSGMYIVRCTANEKTGIRQVMIGQ